MYLLDDLKVPKVTRFALKYRENAVHARKNVLQNPKTQAFTYTYGRKAVKGGKNLPISGYNSNKLTREALSRLLIPGLVTFWIFYCPSVERR